MAPCVAHDGALRCHMRHAEHSQRRHAGHCDACMRHAGHLPAARSGVRCPPPLRCMPPLCPHRVLSPRILCARVLSRRAQVKCATGSVNQIGRPERKLRPAMTYGPASKYTTCGDGKRSSSRAAKASWTRIACRLDSEGHRAIVQATQTVRLRHGRLSANECD